MILVKNEFMLTALISRNFARYILSFHFWDTQVELFDTLPFSNCLLNIFIAFIFLVPSLQKKLETHQITILGRNAKTNNADMCLENSSQKTIPQLNETIDSSLNESGSVRLNSISTSLAPSAEASLSYTGYQSADIEAKEENEERGGSYISEYEGVAKATKTLALTNEDEILSGVDVEKVKAEPEISVRFMYFFQIFLIAIIT